MGFNPLSESLSIDWKIETPIISHKDTNLDNFIINNFSKNVN